MMKKLVMISALALCVTVPEQAFADDLELVLGTRASTSLTDRGEQIGLESLEFEAVSELPIGNTVLYGGVYRLLPVGSDRNIFDNEMDYFIGANFTKDALNIDVSANYITFPAEAAEPSLELVVALGLDVFMSPELVTFYDTETSDFGSEFLLHGETSFSQVDVGITGRAGFVSLDGATPTRKYVGLEARASHSLTDTLSIGIYARGDLADADSFVDQIVNSEALSFKNGGVAFGAEIVLSPDLKVRLPW